MSEGDKILSGEDLGVISLPGGEEKALLGTVWTEIVSGPRRKLVKRVHFQPLDGDETYYVDVDQHGKPIGEFALKRVVVRH